MPTAFTVVSIVDFPLVYHAGLCLGDPSLLGALRPALPRKSALNGWLVTARDIIIIISYTDMPAGAPVPLPTKYKGNRTI